MDEVITSERERERKKRKRLKNSASFCCLLLIRSFGTAVFLKVVGIMRNNMERVLERDAKLADLEDTSGNVDLERTSLSLFLLIFNFFC